MRATPLGGESYGQLELFKFHRRRGPNRYLGRRSRKRWAGAGKCGGDLRPARCPSLPMASIPFIVARVDGTRRGRERSKNNSSTYRGQPDYNHVPQ